MGFISARIPYCLSLLALITLSSGCDLRAPRTRLGTLPTPPPGPRFYESYELGEHSYLFSPFERNGIVYTCKAGHIDITHLRWAADYTRYLTKKTRKALIGKEREFIFRVSLELSLHRVRFNYPDYWDDLARKEREEIAEAIAFEVGPYLAFNAMLWHEILTWFGVNFAGVGPEFNSSFSWEDIYSNLLGTKLALEALKDDKHGYNRAMTLAIDRKLRELGVQPKSTAIYASEKMRGKWFTGYLLVDTIRKNMDIGLDDGYVTPVVVPGICHDVEPELFAVPAVADILAKYGFSMKYEIYPLELKRFEILSVVYPHSFGEKVKPSEHLPILMSYIKRQAVEKYGYIVD